MLSVTYVQNYLRETAYNATDNGQIYPCLHYAPSALSLNGAKHFPMIKKFLSLMSKGADGRDEAILPTTYILRDLEACYLLGGPSSKAACIFDVIYLVLQMIYRCSKYCRDNPTSQYKKICKVPNVNLRRHLRGLSHRIHQFLLLLYVGILPLCVLC